MLYTTYKEAALFEHQFWLQIMGDHARFIINALAPTEVGLIHIAQDFKNNFDQLLNKSRTSLSDSQLEELTRHAFQETTRFRQFKLNLLRQHLIEEVQINLSPTFINHMINELEEYLLILNCLLNHQIPGPLHPIHHHLLWLLDAKGHAYYIHDSLDAVEQKLREMSKQYGMVWDEYHDKAVEMAGYLRTNLSQFPALHRFNQQVEGEMLCFMAFLKEIEELEINEQVLGALTPLIPDHMFREECYYLKKLSRVSNVNDPECNPTSPRNTQH